MHIRRMSRIGGVRMSERRANEKLSEDERGEPRNEERRECAGGGWGSLMILNVQGVIQPGSENGEGKERCAVIS